MQKIWASSFSAMPGLTEEWVEKGRKGFHGQWEIVTRIGQKMCNHHLPAHHCSETTLFAPFPPLHNSVAGQRANKWLVAVIVNSQVSLTAQTDV